MPAPAPEYVPGHGLLTGKTVVVTAAAGTGIGSAVARKAIEEGATVLFGRSDPETLIPYQPFVSALRHAADSPTAWPPPRARSMASVSD